MHPRLFTLIEANAALDVIRPIMAEIQEIKASILERRPELWPAMVRVAGNGGSPTLSRLAEEFRRLDFLVHRILETGAEIKDLSTGLVDFRFLHENREIYLCWKHGEDDIRYWHEIEAGFAGRQSIDAL